MTPADVIAAWAAALDADAIVASYADATRAAHRATGERTPTIRLVARAGVDL